MTHYAACYPHQALLRMPEQISQVLLCKIRECVRTYTIARLRLLGCVRYQIRRSNFTHEPNSRVKYSLLGLCRTRIRAHTKTHNTHTVNMHNERPHPPAQHAIHPSWLQHSVAGYKRSSLSPQHRHGITSAHGKQRYMHGMCYYCC